MIKPKPLTKVGILGYGTYLPDFRISVEEMSRVWQTDADQIKSSLGISGKTVAAADEDSITMAVAAAAEALIMASIKPQRIGAVFMGSESHPYAVKPSGTVVGQALGLGNDYFCVDLQFACKAATAGMQIVAAMIEAGMIETGLVIGSDKAQGRPGDALEYTAASAAAAFVLGKSRNSLAKLIATTSVSSDTPDFWRRPGEAYPQHLGRFTGKPAYFRHVRAATEALLAQTGLKLSDINQVVFHMPNTKFPQKMAQELGITQAQLSAGLTVRTIGNPYSASALVGLARVLEQAQAGEKILMTAYGSGSGSDSFLFKITSKNHCYKPKEGFDQKAAVAHPIDYATYLRYLEVI